MPPISPGSEQQHVMRKPNSMLTFIYPKAGVLVPALLFVVLFLGVDRSVSAYQDATVTAQQAAPIETTGKAPNSVVIELFYRSDSEQSQNALRYAQDFAKARHGVQLKAHDVLTDQEQRSRLWKLARRFGQQRAQVPTFYMCDRLKIGFRDAKTSDAQLGQLLTIRAFIRPGCKHCRDGKIFLSKMEARWPALKVEFHDVQADPDALREVQQLIARHQVQIASFPCIEVAGRLIVGFQSEAITGKQIEAIFRDRSPKSDQLGNEPSQDGQAQTPLPSGRVISRPWGGNSALAALAGWRAHAMWVVQDNATDSRPGNSVANTSKPPQEDPLPDNVPLPDDVPLPVDIPLPQDSLPDELLLPSDAAEGDLLGDPGDLGTTKDEIEVPWLGRLSVSKLGLPAFTFLIGIVDGFNPCAMWVLIFLLSVLVNIKERKKILVVAGTFIVVSGLAYFVFMAAWFSVFQLIGLLRPVQIGLGMMAILVGLINVKDFVAFKKGLTLSIPEFAKPGIYRRVRKIVSANQLATALSGAIMLAIVVNIVELLCTAGLPALYTEVLTMQQLPLWANYSYLALYISAYMLDDTILVAIVVITLSNRRLQEREGRYLKLLSGVVILGLGIVMIFWPEALV